MDPHELCRAFDVGHGAGDVGHGAGPAVGGQRQEAPPRQRVRLDHRHGQRPAEALGLGEPVASLPEAAHQRQGDPLIERRHDPEPRRGRQSRGNGATQAEVTLRVAVPRGDPDVAPTMLFHADPPRPGTGGNVTLLANNHIIGTGRIPHTVGVVLTSYAGMTSAGTTVAWSTRPTRTEPPTLTGTIDTITFDLGI
jgi:hypothetical protein